MIQLTYPKLVKIFISLLILNLSAKLFAHQTDQNTDWCDDGQEVTIGNFDLPFHILSQPFSDSEMGNRMEDVANEFCRKIEATYVSLPQMVISACELLNQSQKEVNPFAIKTHGVFDDYDLAATSAIAQCGYYSNLDSFIPYSSINQVLPVISGPSTFLNQDHHNLYGIEQGLVFTCNLCESRKNN